MPELPEMENYKKLLGERLTGKTVTKVDVTREKTINVPFSSSKKLLKGGKWLALQEKRSIWFLRWIREIIYCFI